MTIRMPPWEEERVALVLGGVEMPDKSIMPLAKNCAARTMARVKMEELP